ARYLESVVDFPTRSLPSVAVAARPPLNPPNTREPLFPGHIRARAVRDSVAPRCGQGRAAGVQEGFDTICMAPLFDSEESIGLLNVSHDAVHDWTTDELDTMAALAEQAAVAIKNAQNYEQMATWAAQLQSIQQLGARLARLGDEREIGIAIATELRQLIDYHNVRVYRL